MVVTTHDIAVMDQLAIWIQYIIRGEVYERFVSLAIGVLLIF